jgi:cholest-4-en-3-one 26-monooxygenase
VRETRDDLASVLVNAEVDGEALDAAEFAMFFLLLVMAGNETTRNLISGGLLALMEYPDQMDRLRNEPALTGSAVEEMLRSITPIMHFRRTATRDVELLGQTIREGDRVTLWYVSANRDEAAFPDAGVFDVARAPNENLTFGGGGPHFCLGAHLARMEARILYEELLPRVQNVEPAGAISRLRSNFLNGIKHLPVRWSPP